MFVTQSKPSNAATWGFTFPKHNRLLHSSDFRRAYKEGMRVFGPFFRAFCFCRAEGEGPRVGLTVPRAVGNAVARNRIKRRMRECARLELAKLDARWDVVFNPRRSVLQAPFEDLRREVDRVFRRCNAS